MVNQDFVDAVDVLAHRAVALSVQFGFSFDSDHVRQRLSIHLSTAVWNAVVDRASQLIGEIRPDDDAFDHAKSYLRSWDQGR